MWWCLTKYVLLWRSFMLSPWNYHNWEIIY
jgi:hypothetical protein